MRLRDVQQTLAGWIRAPEGVVAALAEEDASSGGAGSGGASRRLEALVRSDDALDATGRLEIYANAYFHRILGVLSSDYPALQDRLGADAFHDLATSYLLVEPSRHPSLRHAGRRLPHFISSHEAASGVRARCPEAADLAAFEWARVDVFDAPDEPAMARETLASIEPEAFGSILLRLGDWTRLRAFDHPVDQLWRASIRGEEQVDLPSSEPTSMLVWRKDEAVLHRRIEPLERSALERVVAGIRFDELCETVASEIGESDAPAQAAGWLERWLADHLLADPAPESRSGS